MFLISRSSRIVYSRHKLLKSCHPRIECLCALNCENYHSRNRKYSSLSNNTRSVIFDKDRIYVRPFISPYLQSVITRPISTSGVYLQKEPLKPSSKLEVNVEELKKKQTETEKAATEVAAPVVKKSLKAKVVDELLHYYHGFRLLFVDVKISSVLLWRVLNGKTLSRREYRLLIRTVGDLFRLVPFSVFIIVPFMELLLPFFIKFFPGMLPSTFQTATEKEDKIKQNLKVKLEMAKFLQETLDNMTAQHKEHSCDEAKKFAEWFTKVRTSGEQVSNDDIMRFSKLFEDEITLDSLTRSQLIALCRVLEVQTLGTNNFLKFQLRMKLRSLAADDKMIQKEGVDSLTLAEVQQACRARGMRAYGLSEERVRSQLKQWLDLSLNEKVPPSLLLLSRALMLPETVPTADKLKATISSLPETIVTQTQAAIGEKEGIIDNKVKIELLKEEERRVKEERKERREEKLKEEEKEKLLEKEALQRERETLVDKAPVISAASTPILEDTALKISTEKLEKVEKKEEELKAKDFEIIEHAIDTISKEEKLVVEKAEIQELKEEMAAYKEDVENLNKVVSTQPKPELKESKAARRLFKSVDKMINKLDKVFDELREKEEKLHKDLAAEETQIKKEELLKISDIMAAIKRIKGVPDQSRIDQINKVLNKMDDDHDGSLKIDDVLKVLEIIGKENVNLSSKQVDELIELIDKEEILEVEDKIEKSLMKEKQDDPKKGDIKAIENPKEIPTKETKQVKLEKTTQAQKPEPKPKQETQPPNVPPPMNSIGKSKDNPKLL